jgi:hypothetical protein
MTYTSSQPLNDSERPRQSLAQAVDALKRAVRRQASQRYDRPIPEGLKAATARMMGEKED